MVMQLIDWCCILEGTTSAVFKAAGATAAADCVREREAPEVERASGESGGQAEEDQSHERPSGLQQSHQWEPVYVILIYSY